MFNKYIAEIIGTFVFVGIILNITDSDDKLNPLIIGLGLASAIYLFGNYSGGHFNPVVSFITYLNNPKFSKELLPYVGSQLLGGVSALYLFNHLNNN
jgi:aquaporin Z